MKKQLIEKIWHYNDEAPREILNNMKVSELKQYLEDLRKTYPEAVASEPN